MALTAKKLEFKTVEVTPGIGQLALFRLSGQRQVPVLVDGENVITDSSAIISYLDRKNTTNTLIPHDLKSAGQAYLIEDWADTTLANAAKSALLEAIAMDSELRVALLPPNIPGGFRIAIDNLPYGLFSEVNQLLKNNERSQLLENLRKLSEVVEVNNWLIGDSISIADIAVAAQLSFLSFPTSSGKELAGKGVDGIKNHPLLEPLFEWRDNLELFLQKSNPLN